MEQSGATRRMSRIGLGTVQLGMDYGITNRDGQPSLEEAAQIFHVASDNGVQVVDTAAVYGSSESVIGQTLNQENPFRIVTKTPPLREPVLGSREIDLVKKSFAKSLRRLQVPRVDGLLVHHAPDLLADGGDWLWETLCEFRKNNLAGKIGVSVYDEHQLAAILETYDVDLVQLPLNVLDQRWARNGQLRELQKAGIEVHARSIFLQGVLLARPADLPERFEPLRSHLEEYHRFRLKHELTAIKAALAFALSTTVDCIVIGAARADDFAAVLNAAASLPENVPDFSPYACYDERFINPTKWAA